MTLSLHKFTIDLKSLVMLRCLLYDNSDDDDDNKAT